MSDPYIGQLLQVGFNYAPSGWQIAAGQLISIQQNAALFALLGTAYGGNGTQNFQLPDARGRSLLGYGQAPGLAPYTIGEKSGMENTTLLTSNMPIHSHGATFAGTSVTPTGSLNAVNTNATSGPALSGGQLANAQPGGGTGPKIYAPAGSPAVPLAGVTINAFTPGGNVTIQNTGGSVPFSNLPPYLVVNTIIAMQGIFPPRN